jgi:hypothetical protein
MDAASTATLVEKIIPPTITLLITTSISILVGVYLEKFKSKLIFLKYTMSFSQLGTSIQDSYWGNIEVTYNGILTKYLNFVTITLINDSSNDVPKDIYLDIWVNPQAQILGFSGNYNEIGNAISLEPNFQTRFNNASQALADFNAKKLTDPTIVISNDLKQEIEWVMKNRRVHLPIFNRNSSANINLLVESFDGTMPNIYPSILQTSVKLIKQEDSEIQKKTKTFQINIFSAVVYIIGLILIFISYPESKIVISLTVLIGGIAFFVARLLYLLLKFLKRMFW